MHISNHLHLSYCTNIHPGETWEEVLKSLKEYLPTLKKNLSPNQPFGIGLRLSDLASRELAEQQSLADFQEWLTKNGLYVYTMNGFPYGGFHKQVVKDQVHKPDWTTHDRLEYTKRLAGILAVLLPAGMEGGISTSPLSYKPWHHSQDQTDAVLSAATENLLELVVFLLQLKHKTGKTIHVDLEPEPDGLLENSDEVIHYFNDWLLAKGIDKLTQANLLNSTKAREAIVAHIQVCYDVCHFALAYENPSEAFLKFSSAGIRVGKVQLSAALKVKVPTDTYGKAVLREKLLPFAESTYLHQVVAQHPDGSLSHYTDLALALAVIQKTEAREWRIHFHVPVFTDSYNGLQSTREDVQQVLALLEKERITNHLEVETYTWDVLPDGLKTDLAHSIRRELEWVIETINEKQDAKDGRH
ncbi:metabolite traffic protein EboE [Pontibacter sp. BT731]|uniref:metabolite traffic protein EboE n=1 Tax=Pontibacter coccineus TaxID=3063328 RepID=UPI0026E42EAA|nr:metabolite traffic protein EboE [Pontibacter sp. BT731]MDO6388508.1 metabolite traffic protein EboE [Pontibacter sp. BT731]